MGLQPGEFQLFGGLPVQVRLGALLDCISVPPWGSGPWGPEAIILSSNHLSNRPNSSHGRLASLQVVIVRRSPF